MSCRPNKAISRTGRDVCQRVVFAIQNSTRVRAADGIGSLKVKGEPTDACRLWASLVGAAEPDECLILQRCRELAAPASSLHALPPVAPVVENVGGKFVEGLSDCLDVVLGIIGRSTGKVFIRRRTPIFSLEDLGRRVTVILPRDWRFGK